MTSAVSEEKDLRERLRAEIKSGNARLGEIEQAGDLTPQGDRRLPPQAVAEFKTRLARVQEAHEVLQGLERKDAISQWMDAPAGEPAALRGTAPVAGQLGIETKSIGQMFIESAEFKNRRANGDMEREWTLEGAEMTGVQFKDVHSGSIGATQHPGFGQVTRAPMVQAPMRSWRVRDLFPALNTNSVMIEFIEELGFTGPGGANNAAPVPERTSDNTNFGLKPKSAISFEIKTVPIRTVAHWVPASRNVLDDEPQLRGIVDTRLLEGLRLVEDAQLLNGDGSGQNLRGLLRTSGIQQYPGGAAPVALDTYVDAVRRAATRIVLAEYEPTGLVVHPYDWERMELTKDADGNYIVAGSVTSGAERRLWQLPVIATPAITEGRALIGAFGMGAQVFDRMQSNIRTSEHHEDFFVRNAIVILAEQRLGLAVYRPESFIEVDLPASIPA